MIKLQKSKYIYTLLIFSFVVFILVLNVTFYLANANIKGNAKINREYYEIKYESDNENVSFDKDTIKVRLNGKYDDIYFDMVNIGNVNVDVIDYDIYDLKTNLNEDDININLSFKNDSLSGGKTKRVFIDVKCDECNIDNKSYINFDVKYNFK